MADQILAPGADVDSRRREFKMRMAAAETRGDTDAVEQLQAELDALDMPVDVEAEVSEVKARRGRAEAATARREASAQVSTKDGDDAKAALPAGRSPAPKDTTAAGADSGKK